MNKMKEYERGREDGLDLALRIVRDGGIEALEREIKFRGITGVHTSGYYLDGGYDWIDITAWMPLPKPYKED